DGQNYKTRFCGIQMRSSQYAAVDAVLILAVIYRNLLTKTSAFGLAGLVSRIPLHCGFIVRFQN
ncbi:MAG: hypothetical protein J6D22_01625, partial [Pyramidobacter sp.]|nr:hypothetical protein [Pyramidobacter sp.]